MTEIRDRDLMLAISRVLKERFGNLTVTEIMELCHKVLEELDKIQNGR